MKTRSRVALICLLAFAAAAAAQIARSLEFQPVPELGYRVVPDFAIRLFGRLRHGLLVKKMVQVHPKVAMEIKQQGETQACLDKSETCPTHIAVSA